MVVTAKPLDILAIRFSSLGDVVLTLPALADLRARLPECHLRYLTREPYAGLLELCPLLDEIVRFDPEAGLRAVVGGLRRAPPDVTLDFHGSLRSRMLCATVGGRVFRAPDTHMRRRRMLGGRDNGTLEPVWQVHRRTVSRIYPATPASLDLVGLVTGQHASISSWAGGGRLIEARSEDRLAVGRALPASARARALFPGARWATKRWPTRHYVAVARAWSAQGIVPVVLGAPDESGLVSEIVGGAGESAVGYAEGNWSRLIAWLERCEEAVGNDSGLTHLAEAVGVPVHVLFGPTVPAFGFRPRLEASRVLSLELPCRPCSLHGGTRCPLGHHACLEQLQPSRVLS